MDQINGLVHGDSDKFIAEAGDPMEPSVMQDLWQLALHLDVA
jgi:hypothetical protein